MPSKNASGRASTCPSCIARPVAIRPDSGVEQIFRAGFKEFSRLRQQPGVDPDAVMEGVARAMCGHLP